MPPSQARLLKVYLKEYTINRNTAGGTESQDKCWKCIEL